MSLTTFNQASKQAGQVNIKDLKIGAIHLRHPQNIRFWIKLLIQFLQPNTKYSHSNSEVDCVHNRLAETLKRKQMLRNYNHFAMHCQKTELGLSQILIYH